jgi:hypothetical protein
MVKFRCATCGSQKPDNSRNMTPVCCNQPMKEIAKENLLEQPDSHAEVAPDAVAVPV